MKQSTFSPQLSNFFQFLKKSYAKGRTKERFPVQFFTFCALAVLATVFFASKNAFECRERFLQTDLLIDQLEIRAKKTAQNRNNESNFFDRLHKSEEEFALEELKKINFLKKEKVALERLLHEPFFAESRTLVERKKELLENHINIISEKEVAACKIKEGYFLVENAVEMDGEDLKAFLDLVEQPKEFTRSPQITVKNFSLEKKKLTTDYETYSCHFGFIQRTALKDVE